MIPRGRPRSEAARAAILAAALKLVEERDGAAVTIKAIAEASGAGRQTIYRWWQNRGQIIMEALRESGREQIAVEASAGLEDRLRQFLKATVAEARKARKALAVVMVDAQRDPAFLEEFRHSFVEVRRAAFLALFAVERGDGQLAKRQRDYLADLVYGPLWYRLLVGHAPLDARFADELSASALGYWRSCLHRDS